MNTGRILNIPSLKSSDKSYPSECPCGIHSIDINPSRTLLATGAENTNDLAVYKLPTFDPVMVGEVRKKLSMFCPVYVKINCIHWLHY